MKGKENLSSLNLKIMKDKSRLEKFQEKLKRTTFGVLFVLLKESDDSIVLEAIFIYLEIAQFMFFPMKPTVFIFI